MPKEFRPHFNGKITEGFSARELVFTGVVQRESGKAKVI